MPGIRHMTSSTYTPQIQPVARPGARRAGRLATALGAGGLLSFAFAGWEQAWLAYLALVPLWVLLMTPRRVRAYVAISAAFSFGFFGGLNYWLLFMHPLTWISPVITVPLSLAIVTVAWAGVAALLSVGSTAILTAAAVVLQRLPQRAWLRVLVPAAFWVALELYQTAGTFGYPWGLLAATQYRVLPLLQVVAIAGPYLLSGLLVAWNAALAYAWLRRDLRPAGVVLAVLLVGTLWGAWWMGRPVTGPVLHAALVQPTVSQTDKWHRGSEFELQDRLMALSSQATATGTLVVWPESALPVLMPAGSPLWTRFRDEATRRQQYLMTGYFHSEPGADGAPRYFNAVTAFHPEGRNLGWDAKKHLVPFGEYLPWRHTLPPFWGAMFGALNLFNVDVSPADAPRPFPTAMGPIGTNVCFDSIFPMVMRATANAGAGALVLVTNDGWYKRTVAMQQHLAHGVLRAVESRRPFLQSANTGATAVVDHTGRIVAQAPTWEARVLEARVQTSTEPTPYDRVGDVFAYLFASGALVAGAFAVRRPRA